MNVLWGPGQVSPSRPQCSHLYNGGLRSSNHCLGLEALQAAYQHRDWHWGPVTPAEGLMAPFPQKLVLPGPGKVSP